MYRGVMLAAEAGSLQANALKFAGSSVLDGITFYEGANIASNLLYKESLKEALS